MTCTFVYCFTLGLFIYSGEAKLINELISCFNWKEKSRLASLFLDDADIQLPGGQASPETFFKTTRQTVKKMCIMEAWYEQKGRSHLAVCITIVKRSYNYTRSLGPAVCFITFEKDFLRGKLKIKRFEMCH